jgi:hypothetical protein
MKKTLLCAVMGATLLGGCATTTGLSPEVSQSGFDGSKRVEVTPHGTQCKGKMVCTGIGAVWNNKNSATGLIVSLFNVLTGIQGASLNIDGKTVDLGQPIGLTKMSSNTTIQESENRFVIPYALINEILNGKRVWIRVNTTNGTIEDAIIDENGDSKAYHALKRFKDSVEAAKNQL